MQSIILESKDIDSCKNDTNESMDIYRARREFFKKSIVTAGALTVGSSELFASRRGKKVLNLYSTHLGQTFRAEYFDGERYNITGLFQIDRAMMDFRAWQIARIDLKLIALLQNIQDYVGQHHKISILSGYRSPKTNLYLRRHSRGVAKHSYHMKAEAADIHIEGIRLYKLKDIARGLRMGGVGYYPRSNFIHVDVGPIRHWRG